MELRRRKKKRIRIEKEGRGRKEEIGIKKKIRRIKKKT